MIILFVVCSFLKIQINALMQKMKTQLIQLALRPHTSLKPRSRNKTRWSSTFLMIERYLRFKEDGVLDQLGEDVPEMLELYLNQAEDRQLLGIRKLLTDLQVITKQLQRSDMTFAEMRVIFDTLIEEYPQMGEYIAQDARIVHSPVFESALIKISSRMEHTLTDEEKQSVIKLKRLNAIPRLVAEPDIMDVDANDNAVAPVQLTIMQRAQARLNAYILFLC